MTYDTWRTVGVPLSEERITAMLAGEPVHLIIWPGTDVGTRYVIESGGRYHLTLKTKRDVSGYTRWAFADQDGAAWHALTKADGMAHAATLTRRELV